MNKLARFSFCCLQLKDFNTAKQELLIFSFDWVFLGQTRKMLFFLMSGLAIG